MNPIGDVLDLMVAGFHLVIDILGFVTMFLLAVLSQTDIPGIIEEIIGIVLQ